LVVVVVTTVTQVLTEVLVVAPDTLLVNQQVAHYKEILAGVQVTDLLAEETPDQVVVFHTLVAVVAVLVGRVLLLRDHLLVLAELELAVSRYLL
jgi:hypothetical protein